MADAEERAETVAQADKAEAGERAARMPRMRVTVVAAEPAATADQVAKAVAAPVVRATASTVYRGRPHRSSGWNAIMETAVMEARARVKTAPVWRETVASPSKLNPGQLITDYISAAFTVAFLWVHAWMDSRRLSRFAGLR